MNRKILLITNDEGVDGAGVSTVFRQYVAIVSNFYDVITLSTEKGRSLKFGRMKYVGPPNFRYTPGLFNKILHINPDIIHYHGFWSYILLVALIYAKLQKCQKLIISPHGMLDKHALRKSSFFKYGYIFLCRFLATNRTIFHCLTANEQGDVQRLFPKSQTVVVSNFIERKSYNSDLREYKLLYFGRITDKKNIKNTIKAVQLFNLINKRRNITLDIFGSFDPDSIKPEIEELIIQDPNVNYLGFLKQNHMPEIIPKYSHIILVSYSEGLPMAVLEAMSYGCIPIISSECNLKEGIEEFGYICEHSVEYIYTALTHSINDFSTYNEQLAKMRLYLAKNYYLENKVLDIKNIYA